MGIPSLLFWRKESHPKKQGFFLDAEPLKSLGNKAKTLKKARTFLATKKTRKSTKKQGREDQDREVCKPMPGPLKFGWGESRRYEWFLLFSQDWDASCLLTVEVFLPTFCLYCLQWGSHKQRIPNPLSRGGGTVSRKDQTAFPP